MGYEKPKEDIKATDVQQLIGSDGHSVCNNSANFFSMFDYKEHQSKPIFSHGTQGDIVSNNVTDKSSICPM